MHFIALHMVQYIGKIPKAIKQKTNDSSCGKREIYMNIYVHISAAGLESLNLGFKIVKNQVTVCRL